MSAHPLVLPSACLRAGIALLFVLGALAARPAGGRAQIACGQTITENTLLSADLACPPELEAALVIGASNITLDLGGHTLSGHTPTYGVLAVGVEGFTIQNGALDGFHYGVFLINTRRVSAAHLTVRNMEISDTGQLITGLHILHSQEVSVRDSLFEFLVVPHKEAVEIYDSTVEVSGIEVRSGGAGVSFSFAGGACDPVNAPSNGVVRGSTFRDTYTTAIWVACTSRAVIEGNNFASAPASGIGVQADAPFLGAVTGLEVKNNVLHDAMIGVELRGVTQSSITNNLIFGNQIWGIAVRPSLGCLAPEPGWLCADSTANRIAGNQTWQNIMDLYHAETSVGNTWEGNTCLVSQGAEIPACAAPRQALFINYASGQPGSFFRLQGANFPKNSTAAIAVNGWALGSAASDAQGDLAFILDTAQAGAGSYRVTAAAGAGSAAAFELGAGRLFHAQDGQAPVFVLPGGLFNHQVYLPVLARSP